jgi:carbamoyl-phosphate synthase large subunit
MVIAGGEWQVPIIAEAKRLGHRVLNTNLYKDSPGFKLADECEVADVLDIDTQLRIARSHHPDAVLTDQSDIAVPTVAAIAEALGLPGIGSMAAERFTNKFVMRSWCRELGIVQPRFAKCRTIDEAERIHAEFESAVVVKPPASQSSRGVRRVDDRRQLGAAFANAQQFSSDGSILIETFIDGIELTAEGIATADGHTTLAISTKAHLDANPMVARRLVYTDSHPDIDFDELRSQNDRLIEGLELAFGLTHTEYKYCDGQFFLIETAARGGGTKISSDIVPFVSRVATNTLLIAMALGESFPQPQPSRRGDVAILEFLTFPSGEVAAINGLDEARSLPGVIDLGLTFGVGDILDPPSDDRSRHMHVIATGSSLAEATSLVAEVERTVVVRHG